MQRRNFLGLSFVGLVGLLTGCNSGTAPSGGATPGTTGGGASSKKKGGTFTLGLSVYTGWMPWYYAAKFGILKKWADKHGITIDVQTFPDYPSCLKAWATGSLDAIVITNMDTILGPSSGGLDATVVVTGDYSNGNDAIFARGGLTAKDLQNVQCLMVQGTVTQYLHARMLEQAGLDPSKQNVADISEAKIVTAAEDKSVQAIGTWNPWAMQIAAMKDMTKVFDSSQIPEEIQDLLVVKTAALKENPDLGHALAGAWFEVLALIDDS